MERKGTPTTTNFSSHCPLCRVHPNHVRNQSPTTNWRPTHQGDGDLRRRRSQNAIVYYAHASNRVQIGSDYSHALWQYRGFREPLDGGQATGLVAGAPEFGRGNSAATTSELMTAAGCCASLTRVEQQA